MRKVTKSVVPLFIRAYLSLLLVERFLATNDFAGLYENVRRYPVKTGSSVPGEIPRICHAVDLACIWYGKQVLCLQRSAVAVRLLRHCGIPAQMIIGAQTLPFKSHAWVEVRNEIVNDRPYVREMYAVLDRC